MESLLHNEAMVVTKGSQIIFTDCKMQP